MAGNENHFIQCSTIFLEGSATTLFALNAAILPTTKSQNAHKTFASTTQAIVANAWTMLGDTSTHAVNAALTYLTPQ